MHSRISWFIPLSVTLCSIAVLFPNSIALAQRVVIDAGQDRSAELTNVANIIKTIQIIAYNWIAPAIGSCLAIYGIYKIAVRETLVGTVALVSGGAMFFVQKIVESLQKLAG